MPMHEPFQFLSFHLTQADHFWFWATHLAFLLSALWPILLQTYFGLNVLGIQHELIPFIQRNQELLLEMYQELERKKPPLPSSITNDPDRRKEKASEAAYITEVKTYKAVTINRRISAGYSEP
jgi:hypothetical protein